jgi:hypothetical protein
MKKPKGPSPQQRANLRVCASCEWIYEGHQDCPKCLFGSYGARWVYGPKCYKHAKTQEPWLKKKLQAYEFKLLEEIERPEGGQKRISETLSELAKDLEVMHDNAPLLSQDIRFIALKVKELSPQEPQKQAA